MCALPLACNEHTEDEGFFAAAFPDRHHGDFPVLNSAATFRDAPGFQGEDIFPCSECHDPDFMEVDPTIRELGDPHDTMAPLNHGAGRLWCLDCHDSEDRDRLHLSSGETIPFEEAPKLCGQCHGEKYRDVIGGAHGKRTGHWQEGKAQEVWVCANCHSAHSPRFKHIAPKPAPPRPEAIR